MKYVKPMMGIGWMLVGILMLGCGGDSFTEASGSGGVPAGAAGSSGTSGQPQQEVLVVLSATTSHFLHEDDLSGQTAQKVTAGVRSLELIDEAGGSWLLMNESPGNRTVSYDDAASTELARIPVQDIRPGRYVMGRLVQDWSRLEVVATLHELTGSTEGTLHVFQVTSDETLVNGKTYEAGYFEHDFVAPGLGREYQGSLDFPKAASTAEANAFVEDGVWVVYFPVSLNIQEPSGGMIEVEVNMNQAFRWTDVPSLVNQPEAFDIAPPLYEPVQQFGGNRFVVRWIP